MSRKYSARRTRPLPEGERAYFTLVSRLNPAENWAIEFGDYDRNVVLQEKEDCRVFGTEYKIIRTGDSQASIDDEVARLNDIPILEETK